MSLSSVSIWFNVCLSVCSPSLVLLSSLATSIRRPCVMTISALGTHRKEYQTCPFHFCDQHWTFMGYMIATWGLQYSLQSDDGSADSHPCWAGSSLASALSPVFWCACDQLLESANSPLHSSPYAVCAPGPFWAGRLCHPRAGSMGDNEHMRGKCPRNLEHICHSASLPFHPCIHISQWPCHTGPSLNPVDGSYILNVWRENSGDIGLEGVGENTDLSLCFFLVAFFNPVLYFHSSIVNICCRS